MNKKEIFNEVVEEDDAEEVGFNNYNKKNVPKAAGGYDY